MTIPITESPWAAGPPPVAQANGHRPHIQMPDWASRDTITVPADTTAEASAAGAAAQTEVTSKVEKFWITARAVAPLFLVNGLAVYGQLAYVYDHVAPANWNQPSRIALAIGAAAAVESIALTVGWYAHDALLVKAHSTARNLRRASYLIAGLVATVNYAHFAGPNLEPSAAAVMFGLVSLVSPWLWGLHSRRAQRIQLRKERRIDEAGAEFSSERRRHFPIRTMMARRWSIDHGVTDPREAWVGYNAHRAAEKARKEAAKAHAQAAHTPTPGDAHTPTPTPSGLTGETPTAAKPTRPAHRATGRKRAQSPRRQPNRRPAQSAAEPAHGGQPTAPAQSPTPNSDAQLTDAPISAGSGQPTIAAQPTPTVDGLSDLQQQRLGDLAREFPGDLPGRDKVMAHMQERGYEGWTSKGPAQKLIDLLREQRAAAQPTEEAK